MSAAGMDSDRLGRPSDEGVRENERDTFVFESPKFLPKGLYGWDNREVRG